MQPDGAQVEMKKSVCMSEGFWFGLDEIYNFFFIHWLLPMGAAG